MYPGGGYPGLYWLHAEPPVPPGLPAEEHDFAVEVVTAVAVGAVALVTEATITVGLVTGLDVTVAVVER